MSRFSELLEQHTELKKRRCESDVQLAEIRKKFEDCTYFNRDELQIFCAGSLGRGDVGSKSDLDLFIVSNKPRKERPKLDDLEVLAKLIDLNRDLNYPPFSNDGQYLKIHCIKEIVGEIGSPSDDGENLFTTRMLLLLESRPIFNDNLYNEHLGEIIKLYIRDKEGHSEFKPIFIINDLLRYWRTLCLNYEIIRNDRDKNWRKKNINLKFSRALTVFSAVLALLVIEKIDEDVLRRIFTMSPLERLSYGLDIVNDSELYDEYESVLDDYEGFLKLKERDDIEDRSNDDVRRHAKDVSKKFSEFLYRSLTHDSIDSELRKVLVV